MARLDVEADGFVGFETLWWLKSALHWCFGLVGIEPLLLEAKWEIT